MKDLTRQLLKILDSSGNLYAISVLPYEKLLLNKTWGKTLGYDFTEIEEKGVFHFLHPDDYEETIKTRRVMNEPTFKIDGFKNRYIHKSGRIVYLSWNIHYDKSANVIFCEARDITEDIQNEHFSNDMQKTAKIGYWRLFLDNMSTKWSTGVYDIYEINQNVPTNKIQGLQFYPEDAQKKIEDGLKSCTEHGIELDTTVPFKTAKERQLWVRVRARPVYSKSKIVEIEGTIQDVTDQQNNLIELEKQRANFIEMSKLSSLGKMASGIAHEVNNPLSIMKAYMSLINNEITKPDASKEKILQSDRLPMI